MLMRDTKLSRIIVITLVLTVIGVLGIPSVYFTGDKQGVINFDEQIELPFKLKAKEEVILLYFGYVGCQSICEPSLSEIADIYRKFGPSKKLGFYFINIIKDGVGADAYAKSFHQDFVGLDLPQKEKYKLMNSLRAYSSDSLTLGGDISHTGYLYLIKRKTEKSLRLKNMYYTRPFDMTSILANINKELR